MGGEDKNASVIMLWSSGKIGSFTSERNPDMTDLNYQEEVVCYVMDSGISYLRKKYVRQLL